MNLVSTLQSVAEYAEGIDLKDVDPSLVNCEVKASNETYSLEHKFLQPQQILSHVWLRRVNKYVISILIAKDQCSWTHMMSQSCIKWNHRYLGPNYGSYERD